MARQDIKSQIELTPKRFKYAIDKLHDLGIAIISKDETKLQFEYQGHPVTLYPYSGWHTGKSIKNGRGIELLLAQINPRQNL